MSEHEQKEAAMTDTIHLACGCFLSYFVIDGELRSALACCAEHERPSQTLAGLLGDRYELAIRERCVPWKAPTIEEQLAELRRRFADAEVTDVRGDMSRTVRFSVRLPDGLWNVSSVAVEFDISTGFPYAKPADGFWVDNEELRLTSNGLLPPLVRHERRRRTGNVMLYFWGRLHTWSPRNSLTAYAHVVKAVLHRDPVFCLSERAIQEPS